MKFVVSRSAPLLYLTLSLGCSFDPSGLAGQSGDGSPDSAIPAVDATVPPADASLVDGPTVPPDAALVDADPPDASPPDATPLPTNMALRFDGFNDFVRVQRQIGDDFTIEAWIRTIVSRSGTNFFHGRGLIYADTSGNNNDFGTAILNDHFAFGTGSPDTTIESTTTVTTGAWIHVAAVRTRATGVIQVFVNGVEENQVSTGNTGTLNAAADIDFGGNTIDSRYFDGDIDEIRVWDIARDQAAIQATMNTRLTGNEANLVGLWNLDEGAGGTAGDSSPSGNDGDLGNGFGFASPSFIVSDAPLF